MKTIVLWPEYFDCNLSRRLGRRVPKDLCVIRPSITELMEACKHTGAECSVDESKRYPRTWYISQGAVLATVEDDVSKTALIREVAKALRSLRESRQ